MEITGFAAENKYQSPIDIPVNKTTLHIYFITAFVSFYNANLLTVSIHIIQSPNIVSDTTQRAHDYNSFGKEL